MNQDISNSQPVLFKIILLGSRGVGKSCVLKKFTKNEFQLSSTTTIGLEYSTKNLYLVKQKQMVSMQIWDTAGQERFKSITQSYYRNAIGALLIFDLTDKESFRNLENWLIDLQENSEDGIVKLIIGNKNDLESERQVNKEEAMEFAKKHKLGYIETSAKTGENVSFAFQNLAEEILALLNDEDQTTVQGSFISAKLGEGGLAGSQILSQSQYLKENNKIQQNNNNGQTSKLEAKKIKKKKKKQNNSKYIIISFKQIQFSMIGLLQNIGRSLGECCQRDKDENPQDPQMAQGKYIPYNSEFPQYQNNMQQGRNTQPILSNNAQQMNMDFNQDMESHQFSQENFDSILAEKDSSAHVPVKRAYRENKQIPSKGPNSSSRQDNYSSNNVGRGKASKRNTKNWNTQEDKLLMQAYDKFKGNWKAIAEQVGTRTADQCQIRHRKIQPKNPNRKAWTKEEDETIKNMVQNGDEKEKQWGYIAQTLGNKRTGKQVRERYINVLDPTISRAKWSLEEDEILLRHWRRIGQKWCEISKYLPGRPENMVKNRYYSYLSKQMCQQMIQQKAEYTEDEDQQNNFIDAMPNHNSNSNNNQQIYKNENIDMEIDDSNNNTTNTFEQKNNINNDQFNDNNNNGPFQNGNNNNNFGYDQFEYNSEMNVTYEQNPNDIKIEPDTENILSELENKFFFNDNNNNNMNNDFNNNNQQQQQFQPHQILTNNPVQNSNGYQNGYHQNNNNNGNNNGYYQQNGNGNNNFNLQSSNGNNNNNFMENLQSSNGNGNFQLIENNNNLQSSNGNGQFNLIEHQNSFERHSYHSQELEKKHSFKLTNSVSSGSQKLIGDRIVQEDYKTFGSNGAQDMVGQLTLTLKRAQQEGDQKQIQTITQQLNNILQQFQSYQ